MCIFSQPVISVNNTQIFARISSAGTQLLAYQMNYESQDENAMILPIPVKRPVQENSLRFIDLKGYADFFDDLADGFPYHSPPSIGCSASFDPASRPDLQVFNIGNYMASFVPGLPDFSRLDSRFSLPNKTWAQIPKYAEYGFAVFQLAAGSLKPHPMAFEFQSDRDAVYFPTLHIHDGEIHDTEEFDHVLYVQHAGFDSRVYGYQNSNVVDKSTGLIRSKYLANRFCDVGRAAGLMDGDLLIHRKLIRGNLPNRDTEIATYGDPVKTTLNLRPLLSYTPWLVVFAGIGWFFARRSKLKKMRDAESNNVDQEIAT